MPIVGHGTETYLLLTGIAVTNKVALGPRVELLPATCATSTDVLAAITKTDVELAIAMLFLPLTHSQLHVTADDPRQLAATAWNAQWDCILLSALFDRDVVCNLQSDTPANEIALQTSLVVTNRHLRGINDSPKRQLTKEDENWLQSHFVIAKELTRRFCISNRRSFTCFISLASSSAHSTRPNLVRNRSSFWS